jgi:predicted transcriptional regulator of viral defense system
MRQNINKKIGDLEVKLLDFMQLKDSPIIRSGDMVEVLGITQQRENNLLSNMDQKGLVVRIKKGYYIVSPRIPIGNYARISEYKLLYYIMQAYDTQYLVSGPTAIYYYGYTTQIPNRIYVYNSKISGDKEIGGRSFVFMKTSTKRLKAADIIKMYDGTEVPYTSRARLLIDCIYDWNRYNTIPRVFKWIKNEIKKDPDITEKLVSNAIRYGNKSVQCRLGYFLEKLDINAKFVERMQKKIAGSKSIIPLIPNTDLKGSVNKKWGLIINGQI